MIKEQFGLDISRLDWTIHFIKMDYFILILILPCLILLTFPSVHFWIGELKNSLVLVTACFISTKRSVSWKVLWNRNYLPILFFRCVFIRENFISVRMVEGWWYWIRRLCRWDTSRKGILNCCLMDMYSASFPIQWRICGLGLPKVFSAITNNLEKRKFIPVPIPNFRKEMYMKFVLTQREKGGLLRRMECVFTIRLHIVCVPMYSRKASWIKIKYAIFMKILKIIFIFYAKKEICLLQPCRWIVFGNCRSYLQCPKTRWCLSLKMS